MAASIHAFTMACPTCGVVTKVHASTQRGKSWDARTQIFVCQNAQCGRMYQLGIVAWSVAGSASRITPEDVSMPMDQSLEERKRRAMFRARMRDAARGVATETTVPKRGRVNRTVPPGECKCLRFEPSGECVYHWAYWGDGVPPAYKPQI